MKWNGDGGQQRKTADVVWTNREELPVHGDGKPTGGNYQLWS